MKKMKKINISINEDLLKRADKFGEDNSISRSGLISLSLSQYLAQQEVFVLLKGMNVAMKKIADKGEIDAETMEQLEDFERICNSLVGQ
jgi:metal-responsive CopG/Arc/MetJ family transcriptional regulator